MRDDSEITEAIGEDLLIWYDQHARDLPWRIQPHSNQKPDPYRIWLSEIMLQQTTVAAVKEYFLRFTSLWPTVNDLAAADDDMVMGEWAGLGYYARARNLLKCARLVVSDHEGQFPKNYSDLLSLPGIGPYTAAAISAIAFDQPEAVMDGNIERVLSRLFNIQTPLPAAKPQLRELAARLTPMQRPGDHAQALMDLGATICTPRSPACGICPVRTDCKARHAGNAAELPKKTPKRPKPTRYGVVYMAKRADGAWLLERRPEKGLLGGMLGWPGSDWGEAASEAPPIAADWKTLPTEVRHTFTHFHLILTVKHAEVDQNHQPVQGSFIAKHEFRPSALPTVMRKVYDLGRSV